jgi:hypothetical protein
MDLLFNKSLKRNQSIISTIFMLYFIKNSLVICTNIPKDSVFNIGYIE